LSFTHHKKNGAPRHIFQDLLLLFFCSALFCSLLQSTFHSACQRTFPLFCRIPNSTIELCILSWTDSDEG
jgi:hypothetical protein